MAVFIVTGYQIYECPEHGKWRDSLIHGDLSHDDSRPCPWQERTGWGEMVGSPCAKSSKWIEYQSPEEWRKATHS